MVYILDFIDFTPFVDINIFILTTRGQARARSEPLRNLVLQIGGVLELF